MSADQRGSTAENTTTTEGTPSRFNDCELASAATAASAAAAAAFVGRRLLLRVSRACTDTRLVLVGRLASANYQITTTPAGKVDVKGGDGQTEPCPGDDTAYEGGGTRRAFCAPSEGGGGVMTLTRAHSFLSFLFSRLGFPAIRATRATRQRNLHVSQYIRQLPRARWHLRQRGSPQRSPPLCSPTSSRHGRRHPPALAAHVSHH